MIGADDNIPEIVVASPLPAHIQDLTDRARTYIEAASSANTRRAYAADWKHFAAWCRRSNMFPLPPDPQVVGLYVTACASGTAERGTKPNTVSTIERRLSAIGLEPCAARRKTRSQGPRDCPRAGRHPQQGLGSG